MFQNKHSTSSEIIYLLIWKEACKFWRLISAYLFNKYFKTPTRWLPLVVEESRLHLPDQRPIHTQKKDGLWNFGKNLPVGTLFESTPSQLNREWSFWNCLYPYKEAVLSSREYCYLLPVKHTVDTSLPTNALTEITHYVAGILDTRKRQFPTKAAQSIKGPAMVWMCPPKFIVENFIPNITVLGDEDFGRCLGHMGFALTNWLMPL